MALRIPILVCFGILLSLVGLAWFLRDRGPTEAELASAARLHLKKGDYQKALTDAERWLSLNPDSPDALLLAGEAQAKLSRPVEALRYLDSVPEGSKDFVTANFFAGDILLHEGQLTDAEKRFRDVLKHQPGHVAAHNRLALLLGIEGRRWESAPHLFALLKSDQFSPQILLLLGNLEQIIELPDEIRAYREQAPNDIAPLLGLARISLMEGKVAEAERQLRQVIAARPDLLEAQAQLGHILLDRSRESFQAWESVLPAAADEYPEIWFVRGLAAQRHDEPRMAARCFWEAVRRHPNHQAANYQLGQTLQSLEKNVEAIVFLDRAKRLQNLERDLQLLYDDLRQPKLMEEVSRLMESLGRPWEAWAWYRLALGSNPTFDPIRQQLAMLHARLMADQPPRTIFDLDPKIETFLASLPLPERIGHVASRTAADRSKAKSQIAFIEQAQAAGIDFSYFNSGDPATEGMRMFEFTGGGVGVLDFDLDGWPDLHLTQGCSWPVDAGRRDDLDRIYRNLGNDRFADVTSLAGIEEPNYSQGVAVGDYDGDGFDDLYVANIGGNRFYRNRGDGTFEDVTDETGTAGPDEWSTSCVLADLNGDGLSDLFVVNYVSGDLTRICSKNGVPAACSPAGFDAADDRVYLNLGDGRFADRSDSISARNSDGKGLGVVAADFEHSGRLDLFISNDTTANFYLVNVGERGGTLELQDQALISGLAFDADGRAQACMGVAAGDANADGRQDLFVTNFSLESNTYYVQQPDGLFLDETRQAGLREPSYEMLGFGTQFLDADLDGWEDLVVTNGHVDDRPEVPARMPPQFFRNSGGTFEELSAERLGPWFHGRYLGRGLSKIDWNRDGREDFVVSHLDSPVALVTNVTPAAGRFLAVRLCGTVGNRDAIGAVVTVTCDGRSMTRQLTAGDGYQASNQRQLTFGLGDGEHIDRLVVRWPSGREQTFADVPTNAELILVEGRDGLFLRAKTM